MRRRPTNKNRTRFKPNTRYGTPNEECEWFKAHQGRQYRIRPKRPDEPGEGFVIIKQIYPGRRLRVGIGPEGAMLADNDETLSKVFGILRGGKAGVIFPHDGTIVGEDELES